MNRSGCGRRSSICHLIDLDKMVSMLEINFGEESSLLRTIKEVRDARKWIVVFLGEFVESPECCVYLTLGSAAGEGRE
jgi:hypothetical protein